jgi:hypothetical protein
MVLREKVYDANLYKPARLQDFSDPVIKGVIKRVIKLSIKGENLASFPQDTSYTYA